MSLAPVFGSIGMNRESMNGTGQFFFEYLIDLPMSCHEGKVIELFRDYHYLEVRFTVGGHIVVVALVEHFQML